MTQRDRSVEFAGPAQQHPEVIPPKRPPRGKLMVLGVVLALLFVWLISHLPAKRETHKPAVPVVVAPVIRHNMPVQVRAIGNVTPVNAIQIKSRVEGHIFSIHFTEGQFVQSGSLLFTIDPRPLQDALAQAQADVLKQRAAVKQAQATIGKDRAALLQTQNNKTRDAATAQNANREATRYQNLNQQGAISLEQAEQMSTNARTAAATVQADQAVIENAKAMILADQASLAGAQAQLSSSESALSNAQVQLGYSNITSPITGRTGMIQVKQGNVVRTDQDVLVTVNQMTPMDVLFSVPEQDFNAVLQRSNNGTVKADAYQPNGGVLAKAGTLIFLDNAVDTTTGTVKVKARFANQDLKLWPGRFVNVILTLTVDKGAVVVPSTAVQTGQQGQFVWVVKPDRTVYMQPVQTSQSSDNLTQITAGLLPGQTVVTDGQLQLKPGIQVKFTAEPRG